ncbi:MAG: hypothetical protein R3C05_09930 [Pirellulaceae bacterium]
MFDAKSGSDKRQWQELATEPGCCGLRRVNAATCFWKRRLAGTSGKSSMGYAKRSIVVEMTTLRSRFATRRFCRSGQTSGGGDRQCCRGGRIAAHARYRHRRTHLARREQPVGSLRDMDVSPDRLQIAIVSNLDGIQLSMPPAAATVQQSIADRALFVCYLQQRR